LEYACSLVLARKLLPGRERYNLAALSTFFDISLQHHQAESDSAACAQILLILAEKHEINCIYELVAHAKYRVGWVQQSSYASFCGLHRKQRIKLKPVPSC
jgi:DNA polymerase III epsilon subunit-like protein